VLHVPPRAADPGLVAGYFFSGLRPFSLLFVERRYGVAQAEVSLLVPLVGAGAVVGTLAGGRLADRLVPARLDIMHSRLWGRAESVRTFLCTAAEATGPLVFGFVPEVLTGGGGRGPGRALDLTFLVMLVPLVGNATVLLPACHTYPRDVATASPPSAGRAGRARRYEAPRPGVAGSRKPEVRHLPRAGGGTTCRGGVR
jgi:MFS family permease